MGSCSPFQARPAWGWGGGGGWVFQVRGMGRRPRRSGVPSLGGGSGTSKRMEQPEGSNPTRPEPRPSQRAVESYPPDVGLWGAPTVAPRPLISGHSLSQLHSNWETLNLVKFKGVCAGGCSPRGALSTAQFSSFLLFPVRTVSGAEGNWLLSETLW